MSSGPPFFSVITPSFNQGRWIGGCIRSVLAQGDPDFEHIVMDNVSTDETREVLSRHPHIRWESEPDRGQSHALNKAMQRARGEVICWLNADDQYAPGAFAAVRREMAKPGVHVIFGDAEEIFFDGRPPARRTARFARREDLLVWWEKRTDLLQPAVFFRRSAAEATGPFREDLHLVMDTEFWSRLALLHTFHRVPETLAIQQRQPDSKTLRLTRRIYEEKAALFGPELRAQLGPLRFSLARRRGMGRRWLGLAQSAGAANAQLSRDFLGLSLAENPLLLGTPGWWKALIFTQLMRSRSAQT